MQGIELSIFASRVEAVCEEMGAVLCRAAFSPNIRDRLDYSCAIFDPRGELCAQAAHIPVHLGSMAFAMRDLVCDMQWLQGDMVVVNDPYLGGTHLPDVTVIAPLFVDDRLAGFLANRAHHADIGADSPGSMPISSSLDQEGLIIPPSYLLRRGVLDEDLMASIVSATANERITRGDFAAQVSSNLAGIERLGSLVSDTGLDRYLAALADLNHYGEKISRSVVAGIPDGDYKYRDFMDDDGLGSRDIPIEVVLQVSGDEVFVDFSGTADQVQGNINCPEAVAAAGVFYAFRCLMPAYAPACWGLFRPIHLRVTPGSLLNAVRPAAVAAGNVETSSRVVDVVLGALREALPEQIPAASQGTMNNLAMGSRAAGRSWDYYETLGGGMGAGKSGGGLSGVQTHMTNTLNTPIEVLEMNYPVRICRYCLREGSGGAGNRCGGQGLVREFEFLADAQVTVLSERRSYRPWGADGGEAGLPGMNLVNEVQMPAKFSQMVERGDVLRIETPGGGGWQVLQKA